MIKAVLFDMDGTVFDTEKIYYRSWVRAAEAVGFCGNMHEVMPLIFGVSENDIGKYFYENWGEDFPYQEMLARRAGFIADEIEQSGVPLKSGVPEIFDILAQRGIRSALVSSAPRFRIDDFLLRSGIDKYFDCIISGDRVERSKPAPDIFLLAAEELGLSPRECLVAEDSKNGVLAGYRAGMQVLMIPDLQPFTEELRPYITGLLPSLTEIKNFI